MFISTNYCRIANIGLFFRIGKFIIPVLARFYFCVWHDFTSVFG